MTRKGVEITVQILDIHLLVHYALGTVHQHGSAGFMAYGHQFLNGIDNALADPDKSMFISCPSASKTPLEAPERSILTSFRWPFIWNLLAPLPWMLA